MRLLRSFKLRLFCCITLVGLAVTLILRMGLVSSYRSYFDALLRDSYISQDQFQNFVQNSERQATIYAIGVMAIVVALAALFSLLATKPFEKAAKAAKAVATFEEEPIPVSTYVEIEDLVQAVTKMRDNLKQLDASRQEFVSNVSHELKTPLTSMKVLADSLLIQEGAPVEVYREFMADIAGEIDRETKVIDDLMHLARMDEGKGALHAEPTDLVKMSEDVIKQLKYIAKDKDIDLILEIKRKVTAEVDEVKLAQVVMNLVENGIKYNKQTGYVKVILDADHVHAKITVEDSGLGIAPEDIEHVFERFYRGDKSHANTISGSGLGLSITKKIVQLHRGTIEVSSVLGEGSTFFVSVPLKNTGVIE